MQGWEDRFTALGEITDCGNMSLVGSEINGGICSHMRLSNQVTAAQFYFFLPISLNPPFVNFIESCSDSLYQCDV